MNLFIRSAVAALLTASGIAGAATITLVPGAGFSDSTPRAPEGGNNGATLGAQRTNVFNAAAAIWGAKLDSSQVIKIEASFTALSCDPTGGTLGSAGPKGFYFLTIEGVQRLFPVALAEALANQNINGSDNEIVANFNATIDDNNPNCIGNTRWYYGLSGPTPPGTFALMPVVLHEIGHGLGFLTVLCTSPGGCDGIPYGGYFRNSQNVPVPDIWGDFLRDNTGANILWSDMTDAQRVTALTRDPLIVWDGENVTARLAAFGQDGAELNEGRMRMYTPPTFEPGSSISHFHSAADPNLLMEPALNQSLFSQTDLTDCLFADIGWGPGDCGANTAPALNAGPSPALQAVLEDAPAPSGAVGTAITSLVDFASPSGQLDNVTDPDAGALLGIAITAADASNGSWFYSINNGGTWSALGTPSTNAARTLPAVATARLYFRPNANFNGSVANAITFRAWDQTQGTSGSVSNTTVNGGVTAFSSATDTASIDVTAVNDAPVLNAAVSPPLAPVNEDAVAPVGAVGTLVSALVDFASPSGQVDNVTDVDSGALLGIAITGGVTNGSVFFSTNNGSSWSALGTASTSAARLLAADANTRVYFQPTANFAGSTQAFTFHAWDRSSGTNGATANTLPNGGTTAFSALSANATITVSALNDAPVLDSARNPVLNAVAEDASPPTGAVGTLVSALVDLTTPAGGLDNVTDPDAGALTGIAITAANATNGTWFFSLNSGGLWNALGTVQPTSARLLQADATTRVYFRPNANFEGSVGDALTFRAWDRTSGSNGGLADSTPGGGASAFSIATDTASILVNGVNDPPALSVPSTSIGNEDSVQSIGITVSDPDAATLTLELNASTGVMSLSSTSGLGFQIGDGVADAQLRFTGSVAAVSSAIASVAYAPAPDYNGNALLSVSATDDVAAATSRIVSISVLSVSDVRDDAITAIAGTPRAFNALTGANGGTADTFSGTPSIIAVTQGANGSVGFLADGTLTYTATPTHVGADAFQYTARSAGIDEVGTVVVNVAAANASPSATNLSAPETYVEDTPDDLTDIVVSDADSSTVSATLTLSDPGAGSLSTGTVGGTTAIYVAGTGTWSAGGPLAEVNALLAAVQFVPAPDASASFSITTAVTDGGSLPITGSKAVTGISVNDAPTIDSIADASIPESSAQQTIGLTGIGAGGGENQTIVVSATSSNPSLIANPSVIYTSPGSSGSLQYTPSAGLTGTATITVTVTDNGGTANGGVATTTRQFEVEVVALTPDIFSDGFEPSP